MADSLAVVVNGLGAGADAVLAALQQAGFSATRGTGKGAIGVDVSTDHGTRDAVLRLVFHDINNPLTAIRILSELHASELEDPELRRDASDILEAADLSAALVESTSALVKLDLLEEPTTLMTVDLRDVAKTTASRPAMRAHVVLRLPDAPVQIPADWNALVQAQTDILLTARRLSEGHGAVEVSVGVSVQQGERACLTTLARGASLGERWYAALRRPWGAAAVRRERVPVGATGLAVADCVALRHSGALRLAEDAQGVRFELELPLH
jgi:signal transduction histidine kinase